MKINDLCESRVENTRLNIQNKQLIVSKNNSINLHKALEISILKKITTSNFKNDPQGKSPQINRYIPVYMPVTRQ